ncbi:MAG: thioredoxin [Phycisphaerales bacterium]|nr:thioredoxin [Phycisphaerales bacterium]
MANANITEFTDANWDQEVLRSDKPVLVDFWAEWCGPCRLLSPVIDGLADEFTGKVKVGKLNTENNTDTAIKLRISAIPTVLIFKGGQERKRFVGFKKREELAAAIGEVLGN